MTKKDYELITEVLGRVIKELEVSNQIVWRLDNDFCSRLKEENPHFDPIKFSQNLEKCIRLTDDLHCVYKNKVVAK